MCMSYDERLVPHIIFNSQEPLTPTTPCKRPTALLRQKLTMSKNIKKKMSKNVAFCCNNTVNEI